MDSKVWIKFCEFQVGGASIGDGELRSPMMTQLTVDAVSKTPPSSFWNHSIAVEPKVLEAKFVYLVIVRYQDGNTFGTSHGNFLFYSVRATPEEALADQEVICTPAQNSKEYREWEGYFEKLEGVEIRLFQLKP